MKIKFICYAIKWFDKINGNTYHSVRITRVKDGKTVVGQFQYGYGEHYRQTALEEMDKAKWLPKKYRGADNRWSYERENNYPIYWIVTHGTRKECISNGQE